MTTTQTAAPITTTAPQAAPADSKAAAPTTPAEAARMLKLKVDGQEMEMSEADVFKWAQQGKSADKRFQEAATTRKEAEQIIQFLKTNPKEAFKHLGLDIRKFSEDTLLEMIQHEQMSPEQRQAKENEQKLRKYEEQEKATQEKAKQEQMQALERKHMESYDKMFVEALTQSGLPKTPFTVKRMAELTLVNLKRGMNLEASQLAKIVKEDYIAEQKALFENADGDTLMNLLGKEAVKRLSKAQLSKYKATKVNDSKPQERGKDKPKGNDPISAWKNMKKVTRTLI